MKQEENSIILSLWLSVMNREKAGVYGKRLDLHVASSYAQTIANLIESKTWRCWPKNVLGPC